MFSFGLKQIYKENVYEKNNSSYSCSALSCIKP